MFGPLARQATVWWSYQRRSPKTLRRPGYFIAFGRASGLERRAGRAFVSERLRPDTHQATAAAIGPALRGRPDVLVVAGDSSDLPGCEAIVSAAVGRLAIVGVVAR